MKNKALLVAFFAALGCSSHSATPSDSGSGATGSSSGDGASSGLGESGGGPSNIISVPDAGDGGALPVNSGPDGGCINTESCSLTGTDVVCDTEADCTTLVVPSCGALASVVGVNLKNTVQCAAPPCAPPTSGCSQCQFQGQDCLSTPDLASIVVHCIDHQCLSSLGGCQQQCDAK